MKVLITGASGLVGSEAVKFYTERGYDVIGIDSDMRAVFFGAEASTKKHISKHALYSHFDIDIRECAEIFEKNKIDIIIHCAGAPSHDWSAKDPLVDFGVNAFGTLKLLENCRKYCPEAVFIYVSTNKVYGDNPNKLPLKELSTRYDCDLKGIDETMSVDQCLHSIFGVSKLSADLMVQEYGKYFGLKTGVFRLGCITGARHMGVPLHGFLSYMVRCKKEKKTYKVYGYKGKQVRDNIHAFDLVSAFDQFAKNPRNGEVYNMGGGQHSNISVLEALKILGLRWEYYDEPRKGDHVWYISDVSKFTRHYPEWCYQYDIEKILEDLLR